jgi:putative oxidoreductase
MMRKFESLMEPGEQVKAVADPIFRFLTSLIFIIGGLGHFGRSNEMLARMEESPLARHNQRIRRSNLVALAIWRRVRCCRDYTRAALDDASVCHRTVYNAGHDYRHNPFRAGSRGPLFKNVAILGALMSIFARGPGHYALDNRPRK